jgi:plasmid maintenance system antidote protein VapI
MNNWRNITDTRLVRPRDPGEVIADILDDLNIDNTKFAEILGVSNQIVNEIINGQKC